MWVSRLVSLAMTLMAEAFRWEAEESKKVKGSQCQNVAESVAAALGHYKQILVWALKMGEILHDFSVAALKPQYDYRFTRSKKNVDADGVQFAWKVLALGRI